MTSMLIAKTAGLPPTVREDAPTGRRPRSHDSEDRLHVSALLMGLIDCRACHIDFLDTVGGTEVERLLRRHNPLHHR